MRGTIDGWTWEVERIKVRKTELYGKPYSGVIDFVIVDGRMFAVGLHADKFTRDDRRTLDKIAERFGYSKVEFKRQQCQNVSKSTERILNNG